MKDLGEYLSILDHANVRRPFANFLTLERMEQVIIISTILKKNI